MKPIGEAEIKKHISSGEYLCTYVIFGEETYLKQFYVNKIIKKTVGNNEEFNFARFNGNADMQSVFDAVSQLPFMGEKRCVVLCDFDIDSAKAESVEQLERIIGEQNPSCVFLIWFDTVAVDAKKSRKLAKLVEFCEKNHGAGVLLDKRSDAEILKTITGAAGKRGCRIETTNARYMLEVCGRDLQTLQNELEKLCAYAPGESITREMIDLVAVRTVDSSIFDLVAAINAGNGDKAMGILADLFFQRVEPVSILSVMSGNYVDIYRAKAAEISGLRPRDIASDFGYGNRAFVLDKAGQAAKRMSPAQITNCLQILLDADGVLKSTPSTDRDGHSRSVLEQTIVRLMMCAAGESR